MNIKRIIFYIISVIVCLLLQTSVFDFLRLAGVVPNILLILTATMGMIRGKNTGIVIGFTCGLLIDILSGTVLGQYALVYMLFGYFNGWLHARFYEEDVLFPLGILTLNSILYSFVIFFFFFAMRGRLHFLSYLKSIIIPETVYTLVVAVFLYRIILTIDIWISNGEKRSLF